MNSRTLGGDGPEVSEIGLGCMGMSAFYGQADEGEARATIARALQLGCNFLDTSDMYGPHTNERLVGSAIAGKRDEVFLATKFGIKLIKDDDLINRTVDGSPEYVRKSCDDALRRLGTDYIDLYYQHRVDPKTPIEDTVGALAELVTEGKILHIGLSEAGPETIRRAHAVHPVTALQSEYSLWTRDPSPTSCQCCASSASASWPTRLSAAASSPERSAPPMTSRTPIPARPTPASSKTTSNATCAPSTR